MCPTSTPLQLLNSTSRGRSGSLPRACPGGLTAAARPHQKSPSMAPPPRIVTFVASPAFDNAAAAARKLAVQSVSPSALHSTSTVTAKEQAAVIARSAVPVRLILLRSFFGCGFYSCARTKSRRLGASSSVCGIRLPVRAVGGGRSPSRSEMGGALRRHADGDPTAVTLAELEDTVLALIFRKVSGRPPH